MTARSWARSRTAIRAWTGRPTDAGSTSARKPRMTPDRSRTRSRTSAVDGATPACSASRALGIRASRSNALTRARSVRSSGRTTFGMSASRWSADRRSFGRRARSSTVEQMHLDEDRSIGPSSCHGPLAGHHRSPCRPTRPHRLGRARPPDRPVEHEPAAVDRRGRGLLREPRDRGQARARAVPGVPAAVEPDGRPPGVRGGRARAHRGRPRVRLGDGGTERRPAGDGPARDAARRGRAPAVRRARTTCWGWACWAPR